MKILFTICLVSFLNANEVDTLNSVYIETILFISSFVIMSIISIILSKRSAEKFESENSLKAKTLREEHKKKIMILNKSNADRVIELSKMLEDGLILEKEFNVLKANLYLEIEN